MGATRPAGRRRYSLVPSVSITAGDAPTLTALGDRFWISANDALLGDYRSELTGTLPYRGTEPASTRPARAATPAAGAAD